MTINLDPEIFMRACILEKQLHWFSINPEDQVIEMVLDHHMLSTFRMCPSRFKLEMVDGWAPKGSFWFLEFGALLHKCLEYYYQYFRTPEFTIERWFAYATNFWAKGNFDKYSEIPGYKNMGGRIGFLTMLQEYYLRFSAENERLRIIGTELYFGKGKEVPLLAEPLNNRIPFRLYLSGKIDILCDTSSHIAPMDHKSHGDFRGQNPNKSYEIQEGMTGYIYATRELVKHFIDLEVFEPGSRQTNMILMNHIQVKPGKTSFQDRFSRIPMRRTDADLEEYRWRQVATARDIFNMLIDSMEGIPAQYNAGVCSNWWHNECQFHKVHRQHSGDSQLFVLQNEYIKKPIWDPENRDNDGSSAN
ncbi:MAG TPA: PD-(D/E)XK nuclease family protein [Candidatus Saccharimonadales bacterium]